MIVAPGSSLASHAYDLGVGKPSSELMIPVSWH
jgi:hypothetical protein